MKKILAFGASNSSRSINKTFATYVANQLNSVEVNLIDLNDLEMPIYSIDREEADGIPELAHRFRQLVAESDGIVVSFAEHNGSYAVAFKNIYDWASRIDGNVWAGKPLFLLATSPGGLGGKFVLEAATNRFSFQYEAPIVTFSLPSFQKNFSAEDGVIEPTLKATLSEKVAVFQKALDA